jgi:hypothetical protein
MIQKQEIITQLKEIIKPYVNDQLALNALNETNGFQ